MLIIYTSADGFYDGILQLVQRGLTFKANADKLTIELQGGY